MNTTGSLLICKNDKAHQILAGIHKAVDPDHIELESDLALIAIVGRGMKSTSCLLYTSDPIKDFDFLGITIQFEMCYTNILQILDLSQIPLHAKDRT